MFVYVHNIIRYAHLLLSNDVLFLKLTRANSSKPIRMDRPKTRWQLQ